MGPQWEPSCFVIDYGGSTILVAIAANAANTRDVERIRPVAPSARNGQGFLFTNEGEQRKTETTK